MIDQLIGNCVSFMVQRGAVSDSEEQREIYGYGFELQIYFVINTMILLLIGLLFGRIINVASFIILFGLIQSNGGGYHADTHGKCLFFMVTGTLFFLFLFPLYQSYFLFQLTSVFIGVVIVILLAPVAHKNHPLNPQKSKIMGKRAKFLICILTFAWFVSSLLNIWPDASCTISLSIFFSGVSMLAAWTKKIVRVP